MTDPIEQNGDLWDRFALSDPLWAILSDPAKKGGKWDAARFFETGVAEIASLFYELSSRSIDVGGGSALDFGCGVGRLTQALAPHFQHVIGVDVSQRMLDLARDANRFPTRVSYVSNQAPHLHVLGDTRFDFIVSTVVLQHIPPEIALGYLDEFLRLLAPGGVVIFQLPSHRRRADEPRPVAAAAAMPDDAYRADLSVDGALPKSMTAGSQRTIEVDISNRSEAEWSPPAFGVMRVGNHWLDETGTRMLQRDDGRTPLPGTLRSGGTVRVPLTITAPPEDGRYTCEIDIAHEGVLWFKDKGSATLRFAVAVGIEPDALVEPLAKRADPVETAAIELVGDTGDVEPPEEFPMFGIAKEIVLDRIGRNGASVALVQDDHSCGDDWVSYRYFVSRRGVSGE
jgi:SAM-dependent methyltransferase